MTIPFDLQTFVIAAAVVAAAYVIFGILASGATLLTVPVLSHFYPLDFVLPMCALLLPFAPGACTSSFGKTASIFGSVLEAIAACRNAKSDSLLASLWAGNRIHARISREHVLRVLSVLLLLMGLSLIVRAAW